MKLGLYYIDLNKSLGEDFSEYEFDEQGVPLTRFHRTPEWQHNPITVCQYGLNHFNLYLRRVSIESKQVFLTQAQWLLNHQKKGVNDSAVWHYLFDLPFYDIHAPWVSGMAQGQALSLLLRAHQITHQEKYLELAHRAWNIFNVTVEDGGVIGKFSNGEPVIEEYPSLKYPTCVLNGFLYALFGIYDYSIYTDNKSAQSLFLTLTNSLKNNLYRYDSGYWSYYDLKHPLRFASKPYHQIHIKQLKTLCDMTEELVFNEFQKRWQGYFISFKSKIKWLLNKIHQKVINRI